MGGGLYVCSQLLNPPVSRAGTGELSLTAAWVYDCGRAGRAPTNPVPTPGALLGVVYVQ